MGKGHSFKCAILVLPHAEPPIPPILKTLPVTYQAVAESQNQLT